MAETSPGGPSSREGDSRPRSEQHLFAEDFMDVLGTDSDYMMEDPEQQELSQPFLAHEFVRTAAEKIPPPYRQPWHELLQGDDVDIEGDIEHIHDEYGTYTSSRQFMSDIEQNKRARHLANQSHYALRYYNRYPEILGAFRLAEQLHVLGLNIEADAVDVLLAAYGAALRKLPDHRKQIPLPPYGLIG